MSCFRLCSSKPQYTGFFVSGQHTEKAWKESEDWSFFADAAKQSKDKDWWGRVKAKPPPKPDYNDIKYSAPPFNLPKDNTSSFPREKAVKIDVACYGTILDEVMTLFSIPEIRHVAEEMGVKIPVYAVDTFVQGKAKKITSLAAAARKMEGCNDEAAANMEKFATEFGKLDASAIKSLSDWNEFVQKFVTRKGDWAEHLGFKDVLSNFGFEQDFAERLRQQTFQETDPKTGDEKTATWEQEGLRWLAKALGAYKPVGCLVDVVNLVFAMLKKTPEEIEAMKKANDAEKQIKNVIKEFHDKIRCGNLHELWVPGTLLCDCEVDDMLAWCLLQYVHEMLSSNITVLAQLPVDEEMNWLADKLQKGLPPIGTDANATEQDLIEEGKKRVKVFRDEKSGNLKALKHLWDAQRPESTKTGEKKPDEKK